MHSRPVVVKTVQLQLEPQLHALLAVRDRAEIKEKLDQRVLANARAAQALHHPHIANVLEAGLSPFGVFVATERLPGRNMREALDTGWRPRPSLAALIMRRVAEALAHAHAQGLVHGNLKPTNIFLDDRVQPKLLDFGLMQAAHSMGVDHRTVPVGTLQYLAPEQLMHGVADERTDVRAVGVVLYELLTSTRPFGGHTAQDVTREVLDNEPIRIEAMRGNVPRTLVSIAARAMARQPEHRFSSADELARALADWIDRHAARKLLMAQTQHERSAQRRRARQPSVRGRMALAAGVALGCTALAWPLLPNLRFLLAPIASAGALVPATSAARAPTPTATVAAAAPTEERLQEREMIYAAKRVGVVSLEVSPTAEVVVNGALVGTTPPMTQLRLPVGQQSILLKSAGFSPYMITVYVRNDQPLELRHHFSK